MTLFRCIGISVWQMLPYLFTICMYQCYMNQFGNKNYVPRLIGEYKMLNFTRQRLVICKRIRSQWSISTIICICTIAYEDYIICSSVCVVYHRYYVAPFRVFHI